MCADYTPSRKDRFAAQFQLDISVDDFDFKPEAFPGYMAPIVRTGQDATTRYECVPACFGMVPHWADMKLARQTYNARTETVATKSSYRNAWKRRQFCVIPADNFFEPCYETGKSIRWRIEGADGGALGIAGIWEYKHNGPDDRPLVSFSMLTINADDHALMRRFHKPGEEKRMVVILPQARYSDWLAGLAGDPAEFLLQYPAELLLAAPHPLPPRKKATPVAAE